MNVANTRDRANPECLYAQFATACYLLSDPPIVLVLPVPDSLCKQPQRALVGQEVVGQPGGHRVAKRTLNRKDDTA